MTYKPFTTAKGVLDKYVPGDAEFDLPEGLVDQLRREEYGPYADAEGNLRVCFLGSNHPPEATRGHPRSMPPGTWSVSISTGHRRAR